MTAFSVFTADGRSSPFTNGAAEFLVQWKEALIDPEKQWPFAYMDQEGVTTEVVHFNPMLITAVSVGIGTPTGGER